MRIFPNYIILTKFRQWEGREEGVYQFGSGVKFINIGDSLQKKGIYYIVINFCFMTNLFHEVKCSLSIMAGNRELSFWCGQYMVTCEDRRSYILP